MQTLLRFLYLSSLFVWIGGITFFSFIVTPTLFKQIPKEMVTKVLEALFPKYYFMGYFCGAVALLTHLVGGFQIAGGFSWYVLKLAVLIGMVVLTYYAGLVVYPEVHRLKTEVLAQEGAEANPQLKADFDKMHRVSVLLNLAVLILGLVLIFFLVKS